MGQSLTPAVILCSEGEGPCFNLSPREQQLQRPKQTKRLFLQTDKADPGPPPGRLLPTPAGNWGGKTTRTTTHPRAWSVPLGSGAARRGEGWRFQGSSRAQLQGIDMALPELACNRRPDPAHRTPSSLVPGRAFSSLPLLRARTRGRVRMRVRACGRASTSDPSPARKTKLTWIGNSASHPRTGQGAGRRYGW